MVLARINPAFPPPPISGAPPPRERRILILAPTGNDARLAAGVLGRAGIDAQICRDMPEIFRELVDPCGAVLLAEETLSLDSVRQLLVHLGQQPPWSDLPMIIITSGSEADQSRLRRLAVIGPGSNVSLLERPFGPETLTSAIAAALRARSRQYQVRDLLAAHLTAQKNIRETVERLNLALAAPNLGSFDWDATTDLITLSARARDIFGLTTDAGLTYTRMRNLLRGADRERARLALKAAMETRGLYDIEFRIDRPDGRLCWVATKGRGIYTEDGRPAGMVGVVQDISQRKYEEAMRAGQVRVLQLIAEDQPLEQVLSTLIETMESATDGRMRGSILLLTEDRAHLRYGAAPHLPAAYRQAVEGLAVGESSGPCGAAADRRGPVYVSDIASDPLCAADRELARAHHLRACWATPIFGGDGQLLGTFALYFSETRLPGPADMEMMDTAARTAAVAIERQRATAAVNAARDAAERANRAKDDFLAALSHELRTPLNPVLLLATEAAADPKVPPDLRADFDTIAKNVMLEARLIDDLLDLTRITRGKLRLDRRPTSLHGVLQDAIANVQAEVGQKPLTLAIELERGTPIVEGDPVRLQQVFWNVLKNAAKFTPAGGRISVRTLIEFGPERVAVEIADTGIGLAPDELKRIFDAFAQGDHAGRGGSHRFGGLGLGLAISRTLVELHAGSIRAASEGIGRGCRFTIELPLIQVADPMEAKTPRPAASPGAPAADSPLRILLVEDHEPTRRALAQLLGSRHHDVAAAGSLAEAWALGTRERFDLLITDIGLPDGSGYDLMEELGRLRGLKGIALTGYGTEQDVERSHKAGFVAHLTKPVPIRTLDAALGVFMDSARP